jgi:hypothetical protein
MNVGDYVMFFAPHWQKDLIGLITKLQDGIYGTSADIDYIHPECGVYRGATLPIDKTIRLANDTEILAARLRYGL